MAGSEQASVALVQLRERLCSRTFAHSLLQSSSDSNFRKLKFHISSSISSACSKVLLLCGDKGSGKAAVVELVLKDLKADHPNAISIVKLYGLLHSDDDNSALEEIARQLCSGSARGNCPFFPTRPLPPFPYAISCLYKIYLHSNYSLALPPSPPLPSQLTPRGDLCNKTPQAYRTKWQAQSKRR